MFYIFKAFIWLIAYLPLGVLYVFSDLLFPIIYHLIRYRRKVVRKNLINSFPEKSLKEIIKIERKFYHHFCDSFFESIYLFHMSEKEVRRRVQFENIDLILKQYEAGKSIILMSAHYANWDWMSALSLYLPADAPIYGIYKQLTSKHFDTFMRELRESYNSKTIETQELFRTMLKMKSEGKLGIFGLISDQTPRAGSTRHWTRFMNQDTPVIVGAEQLARKFNYPIFFANIERPKRGYYRATFEMLEIDEKDNSEYPYTEKFTKILESKINEKPEFWLWSHKRWKYKKPA